MYKILDIFVYYLCIRYIYRNLMRSNATAYWNWLSLKQTYCHFYR